MARKRTRATHTAEDVRAFFGKSDLLDRMALRPLDHIAPNWEALWDEEAGCYEPEAESFATELNKLIHEISNTSRPVQYHHEENTIIGSLRSDWPLQYADGRWETTDYALLLERAASTGADQRRLLIAVTGRTHAALDHGQSHFDEMEWGHLKILAGIITIIMYLRYCDDCSIVPPAEDD